MMDNSEQIWVLMARKLSGEASGEELSELERLLREDPHTNYSKEILHDLWQNNPLPDSQYAESRYKELIQQMKSLGIIEEGKFIQDEHYIVGEEPFERKSNRKKWLVGMSLAIMAGITAAVLFFTGGSANASVELAEGNAKNQISTKRGSKTSLVLPDGTKVWLNASSELTYDKNYGNKIREVSLIGEAYFDVVKNAARPFVIHTSKMDVKVLGTAFDVKCYPGEKTTETSLVRGSIEVTLKDRQEKIMLKPNEKLVINNEEEKGSKQLLLSDKKNHQQSPLGIPRPIISVTHLTLLPLDSTIIETAWVQNRLIFSSETFEEVALKMERWYDVKISFAAEALKVKKFTGSFGKESVVEALNALQLSLPFSFSYAIKNNSISISTYNRIKK